MKKLHNVLKAFGSVLMGGAFLVVVVLVVVLALLIRKPEGFEQIPAPAENDNGEVSRYLTHYLAPNVYNNFQLDQPFEVIVTQDGINGIIAEESMLGWGWPVEFNKTVTIDKPVVFFTETALTIMANVKLAGLNVVVTVSAMPVIDDKGLLHLNFQSVKAGALDISRLAKSVTGKVIASQLGDVENDYWLEDLRAACLENKPFDPVFPAYDKYIRLKKSKLSNQRLVLFFEPATEPGQRGLAISF